MNAEFKRESDLTIISAMRTEKDIRFFANKAVKYIAELERKNARLVDLNEKAGMLLAERKAQIEKLKHIHSMALVLLQQKLQLGPVEKEIIQDAIWLLENTGKEANHAEK